MQYAWDTALYAKQPQACAAFCCQRLITEYPPGLHALYWELDISFSLTIVLYGFHLPICDLLLKVLWLSCKSPTSLVSTNLQSNYGLIREPFEPYFLLNYLSTPTSCWMMNVMAIFSFSEWKVGIRDQIRWKLREFIIWLY